jgi:hypothetical protein
VAAGEASLLAKLLKPGDKAFAWYGKLSRTQRAVVSALVATGITFGTGGFAGVSGAALFFGSRVARGLIASTAAFKVGEIVGGRLSAKTQLEFTKAMEEAREIPILNNIAKLDEKVTKALRKKARDQKVDALIKLGFVAGTSFAAGQGLRLGEEALSGHGIAGALNRAEVLPHRDIRIKAEQLRPAEAMRITIWK